MAGRRNRLVAWALLVAALGLLCPAGVGAAGGGAEQVGPADPAEVEAFMEDFWTEEMQPLEIPGAVFVLVREGEILFAKGYGVADVERGVPVDPGETLFAIGSVSKAITASVVMQLVERGQLRLDAPVDSYLKSFQIGDRCPEPVTTAHLLTHTAGFDERVIGTFVTSPDELIPLAEYVARDLPPCIRPPGQEMSYCNHCYGLAGLVVEEVSHLPFERYAEENLFRPLNMYHSTFRQPLPAALDALRARGYIFAPERQPAPQVYGNFFPSGGGWASGADMGRFIIGLLQGGLAGGEPVFARETLALMHQRQFSQNPRLEGWTYGFFEHMENGRRMIGKDGDAPGFSSALYLMPEENVGFFLSYNATVPTGQSDPRMVFPSRFLDRYFPGDPTLLPAKPSGDAPRLSGFSRWSRFCHTNIDKAISPMLLLQWQIRANPDGSITLAYPSLVGGQTSRWMEVAPGLFQNQGNGGYMAFEQDRRGRVTHVYTRITEEGVLERVAWYETLVVQALVVIFLVGVFATVLGIRLVGLARRLLRTGRDPRPLRRPGGKALRLTTWLSSALAGLGLIFLDGLAWTVVESMTVRAPQVPPYMVALLVLPLVAALLALLVLGLAVAAWWKRYGSIRERVQTSLAGVAGVAFVWFAWYWNLLGFKM